MIIRRVLHFYMLENTYMFFPDTLFLCTKYVKFIDKLQIDIKFV